MHGTLLTNLPRAVNLLPQKNVNHSILAREKQPFLLLYCEHIKCMVFMVFTIWLPHFSINMYDTIRCMHVIICPTDNNPFQNNISKTCSEGNSLLISQLLKKLDFN